jgi:hypothetical protein
MEPVPYCYVNVSLNFSKTTSSGLWCHVVEDNNSTYLRHISALLMRVLSACKHRKLYETVQRIIKEKTATESSAILYYLFMITITNKSLRQLSWRSHQATISTAKELGLDLLNGLRFSFHQNILIGSGTNLAFYPIGIRESACSSICYVGADTLLLPATSLLCGV